MENRISPTDEKKLTRAIEKAATLASINTEHDRDRLLASSLKEAGIDKRFAKAASAAFNKRLTVLTLKKTADEHKADPFALSNADVVYGLMGGEVQQKTASLQHTFEIAHHIPMQKAASVQTAPKRPRYEETVDYQVFQNHLESMLDKHAAAVSELSGTLETLESEIKEEAKELADYFQKSACASFEFTNLNNAYGDAFKEALQEYLPETTDFSKTASAVVLPEGGAYDKAKQLLEKRAAYADIQQFFKEYCTGLQEFCKTAAQSSNFITKCEYHGLPKKATGPATAIGAALRGTALTGMTAIQGLENVRKATTDAAVTSFQTAREMYNAGDAAGMAPSDVLDSEFLVKDRFRDRLLAWSDMSADPQFAMYPAEQVFQATQKAMDINTSLERPDYREVLRTEVAQLLAQNNRVSTADIAALATTLRGLSAAEDSASMAAAAPLLLKEKKEAPKLPELATPLAGYRVDVAKHIESLAKGIEKAVEDAANADAKAKAEAKATQREQAKELRREQIEASRDAQKRLAENARDEQKRLAENTRADQRLFMDFVRLNNIRPERAANGNVMWREYDRDGNLTGRAYTQQQVQETFTAFRNATPNR